MQFSIGRKSIATAGIAAMLGAAGVMAPSAQAAQQDVDCAVDPIDTYHKVFECVTYAGTREHQRAFQQIADESRGSRAERTSGYTASVDYVMETLAEAGWEAEKVSFTYPGFETSLFGGPELLAEYATGSVEGTAVGAVRGTVVGIDLSLDEPAESTSGCEKEDFADVDLTGDAEVALLQRGNCPFADKVFNAHDAGAEAVIIFNQGVGPDGMGLLDNITLGDNPADIPVVAISLADGRELAEVGGEVAVDVEFTDVTSYNVIGTLPGEVEDTVVMAGAHLDSVTAGPGINDNGSGAAGLLEVAQMMANTPRYNTVQFAFWGAEEFGLVGSTEWVRQRSEAELDTIALYLNFDMIGSPNYIFQVYDANESSYPALVDIPEGSEAIERVFEQFYTRRNLPYDDSEFSGRSDYQAFIDAGIPSGGLFTGAEQIKTDEQARIWGGTAGEQLDPCYHAVCDNVDNVNRKALLHNIESIASSVFTFQHSTAEVNGLEGIEVAGPTDQPEPAGPQRTMGEGR